jgi:hypothetical protein
MADLPKNQHYVAQFLLNGFRANEKEQIHVFDKHQERTFRTAIRNVAAECGFYNYKDGATPESAEPFLANMEADCSRVINRIRDAQSIASLTAEDRATLTMFTGIQILRVKQVRRMLEEMNTVLHDKIVALGGNPAEVQGYGNFDADGLKKVSIDNLSIAKDLAPHINNKAWMLLRAPSAHPLYISDNPVVLQSSVEQPGFRGLGIGVDGIEIYLPISTQLTLLFLCRKLASQFLAGAEMARMLKQQLGFPVPSEHIGPIANAIKNGCALDIAKENVENLNSLQVLSATRFVFAATDVFAVARDMISKQPGLKHRPTFQVN